VVGLTLLRAENVHKNFGVFRALDGVSLAIGEGEHVSVIGPNGAGKTTLVNVLTGLLRPTSGTVTFKGRSVAGRSAPKLARMGMARSFQLVNIFPELTVRETIEVAATSRLGIGWHLLASASSNRQVEAIVADVAGQFGFADKLEQPARSLAQGDKKLLDVASAFALKPEVILLDEPTSGVSTADKTLIMEVLTRAARHSGIKAIIQVEHDMDIVFGYSNRIIAVHNGRILADGTPDHIRSQQDVMTAVVGRLPDHA
jgi:branched-chain amino acid transport system ATP-binding protein